MKHLDLFSGIGGFALAGKRVWGEEYINVGHSEVEPFACKVYHKHFPESKCLGDITKINWEKGYAEIITGGFPCQPHSVVGKRLASEDERDLWSECLRSISEIRPNFALFENVTGLFTSERGGFFNRILSDLASIGYDAEWRVVEAGRVGSPHLRQRVWILSYPSKVGIQRIDKGPILRRGELLGRKSLFPVQEIERRFPSFESRLCRTLYGIPNGMDRIGGLGNSIVPQVAELIFGLIKKSIKE